MESAQCALPAQKSTATKPKPASATEKIAQADELVKKSLFYEISGQAEDRNQLLAAARDIAPNFEPAHWQSGEVKFENHWTKIDDVPQLAKKDSDLGAYEAQRNRAADTLEGQLNLALVLAPWTQ